MSDHPTYDDDDLPVAFTLPLCVVCRLREQTRGGSLCDDCRRASRQEIL